MRGINEQVFFMVQAECGKCGAPLGIEASEWQLAVLHLDIDAEHDCVEDEE